MLGNNDYGWTPGKAAKISLKDKICPECLRLKATNGREAGKSIYCPKWYAVNDDDAKRDCEMVSKAKQAAGITSDDESCGCCKIYRTEWSQARTEADELFMQREQLHTELLKAREELRGADEYQAGLRTEIARQVGLVDATKAALASALRREEDQILLRHTNNEQHDQTKIKLLEAMDIIWDLVRNLDAADSSQPAPKI